ncbi:MAG: hypothetical protein LUG57_10350 [Oscillospiraceae bacterium]|nr:hypothetical protein [Oscillospiraceae bacterium]
MKSKRFCFALLAMVVLLSALLLASGFAFCSGEATGEASSDLPENFYFMEDVTIGGETTGGKYYIYISPDLYDFDILSNFLNSVFFVYPDTAPASAEEAYEMIQELGLIDIADQAPGCVVVPLPINGDSWSEDDLAVYYEAQYYLAGGVITMGDNGPEGEYDRHTMNTLQYIIAEGSGATFVNNVLSQNASRIAGILTFGGEIDETLPEGLAIPAYLVNASEEAVAYYKAVNEVDAEEGNIFYNSEYAQKKVIVAEGTDELDAELIEDAWASLLSRTMRLSVSANLVLDSQDMSDWILMDWPNLGELGIEQIYHTMNDGDMDRDIYDFVPQSVLDSGEEVPLVLVLHGGNDDPVNVVKSCGWAQLAAEEEFIVIAPDYQYYDDAFLYEVIQYAIETYSIDTSRIYVFGFSMGGKSTASLAFAYPDLIAAAAPFGATDNASDTEELVMDAESYDMPFIFMVGTNDSLSCTVVDDITQMTVLDAGASFWANILDVNEIEHGEEDFEAQEYWGFVPDEKFTVVDRGLSYEYSCYSSDEYSVPLVELVAFIDAGHANSDYQATAAWEFMSQFARAEDGSLIEIG